MWSLHLSIVLRLSLFLGTLNTILVQPFEVIDSEINHISICPISCINSRCYFNNSRAICTDGCEEGRRGDNCSIDCPPKCSDCSKYQGGSCDELCLSNCDGGYCDRYKWQCASCKPGFTGRFCDTCMKGLSGSRCDQQCSDYCPDGCERDSGFCSWRDSHRTRYCTNNISEYCLECETNGTCKNCIPDFWGDFCNQSCPTYCDMSGCDQQTGECWRCTRGYWGGLCNQTCPTNCDGSSCSTYTGKCRWCTDGYWGDFCNQTCPVNCYGSECERLTGKCLMCLNGYWGGFCNMTCPKGCSSSACGKQTGKCGRCTYGFWGNSCHQICPTYCDWLGCERHTAKCRRCTVEHWGDYCDQTCPKFCHQSGCDKHTGKCWLCVDGYWGDECSMTCPTNCISCNKDTGQCTDCKNGFWGHFCNKSCSPHCNICNQFTGHCYSCKTGYQGGLCNESCPLNCKGGCNRYTGICVACVDGYAGRHCKSTCTSDCSICDFDTGHCISCKIGKRGNFCKESCPSTCISCDIHSGECEKCQPGYRGRFCVCQSNCEICDLTTEQCERCINNTFYGKSCSIPCPDACAGCEKATGSCVKCSQGYGRVYCDEMCTLCSPQENCSSKPCVHRDDQWLWKVLAGTLSTLCIIAVNVLLWVKRARRVRRSDVDQENQGSMSNDPQDQPEYHLPYNHYHEIANVDDGPAPESDTCSKPLVPPLPALRTISTNNHRVTTQETRHLDSDVPNVAISIRTLPPSEKSNKQKPQGNMSRDTDPLALPPPLCPRPKVTPIENHTRARRILQASVLRGSCDPQVFDHRILHPTFCLQPLPLRQHTSSMSNAVLTPQGSKCLGADQFALNAPPLPRRKMVGRNPNREMLHGRMFEADEVFEKTSASVSNNVDQAVGACHDVGHKMVRTDDCSCVEMRNFQAPGPNHHQRFLQRRHSDSELPTYECKTNEHYHLDKSSKVDNIKSENAYFAYKGISRSFTSLNVDINPTDIYITPVMDNMYRLSPHH